MVVPSQRSRAPLLGLQRLDREQELTFLDNLAVRDVLLKKDAARARPELDFLGRDKLSHELPETFNVAQLYGGDLHRNLRHLWGRRVAAGRERRKREQTRKAQGELRVPGHVRATCRWTSESLCARHPPPIRASDLVPRADLTGLGLAKRRRCAA